jgi:hypothetical protein
MKGGLQPCCSESQFDRAKQSFCLLRALEMCVCLAILVGFESLWECALKGSYILYLSLFVEVYRKYLKVIIEKCTYSLL